MFFRYYDWTFIIIIPAVLFAFYAQSRVRSSFKKYQKYYSQKGYTAREVARIILDENGLTNIHIDHVSGELTDHFDPKSNVIRLSDSVENSTSIAAIGIAAHEVGHAIQHAEGYTPIKARAALVPATKFGSTLAPILILIGIILTRSAQYLNFGYKLAIIGLLAYSLVAIFQFITLPVEFNASKRALVTLERREILTAQEIPMAKKVLSSAALTYVAALVSSLSTILRLALIISGNKGRRR